MWFKLILMSEIKKWTYLKTQGQSGMITYINKTLLTNKTFLTNLLWTNIFFSHLRMKQSLHSLSINMRHQIPWSEPCVKGRAAAVDFHDQVVHRVHVRVAEVDADGADSEAEAAGAPEMENCH